MNRRGGSGTLIRRSAAGMLLVWILATGALATENPYRALKLFTEVMELVRKRYVEGIGRDSLTFFGLKGLLDSLDSYTLHLEDIRYRHNVRPGPLSFAELGVCVGNRGERLLLVAPLPGSLAHHRGLMPGDFILEVDGETTMGMSLREVLASLAGRDRVSLLIARSTLDRPLRTVLTASSAHLEPFAALLQDSVGYVRPGWIVEGTGVATRSQIARLAEGGLRALVLDLRTSPGENLDEAAALAELFLAEGATIGYVVGRGDTVRTYYRADGRAILPTLPVAVLVGPGTCCGGELVAASLKTHRRCVLVGAETFGKGTLQKALRLTPSTGIVLTHARWYTPDGRCIDRELGGWDTQHEAPPPQVVAGVSPHLAVTPDSVGLLEAALRFAGALPAGKHEGGPADVLARLGFEFLPTEEAVDSALAAPGSVGRPIFSIDHRATAIALVADSDASEEVAEAPLARLRDDRAVAEALDVLSSQDHYRQLLFEGSSTSAAPLPEAHDDPESGPATAPAEAPRP